MLILNGRKCFTFECAHLHTQTHTHTHNLLCSVDSFGEGFQQVSSTVHRQQMLSLPPPHSLMNFTWAFPHSLITPPGGEDHGPWGWCLLSLCEGTEAPRAMTKNYLLGNIPGTSLFPPFIVKERMWVISDCDILEETALLTMSFGVHGKDWKVNEMFIYFQGTHIYLGISILLN